MPLGLPGEAVVRISPLATPQADPPLPLDELANVSAVALFTERARAIAPDFALTEVTVPAITDISRRLGGLPLAIELAAARLRVLSPGELAASMERDVDPVLTLIRRHWATAACSALEGAWASLSDSQRRTLDRLAIFPAGWGRVAAGAVAAATVDDLTPLIAAGRLRQEAGDRFVLHNLVRRIAARRLAQAGEDLTVALLHAEHATTERALMARNFGRERETRGSPSRQARRSGVARPPGARSRPAAGRPLLRE